MIEEQAIGDIMVYRIPLEDRIPSCNSQQFDGNNDDPLPLNVDLDVQEQPAEVILDDGVQVVDEG